MDTNVLFKGFKNYKSFRLGLKGFVNRFDNFSNDDENLSSFSESLHTVVGKVVEFDNTKFVSVNEFLNDYINMVNGVFDSLDDLYDDLGELNRANDYKYSYFLSLFKLFLNDCELVRRSVKYKKFVFGDSVSISSLQYFACSLFDYDLDLTPDGFEEFLEKFEGIVINCCGENDYEAGFYDTFLEKPKFVFPVVLDTFNDSCHNVLKYDFEFFKLLLLLNLFKADMGLTYGDFNSLSFNVSNFDKFWLLNDDRGELLKDLFDSVFNFIDSFSV